MAIIFVNTYQKKKNNINQLFRHLNVFWDNENPKIIFNKVIQGASTYFYYNSKFNQNLKEFAFNVSVIDSIIETISSDK